MNASFLPINSNEQSTSNGTVTVVGLCDETLQDLTQDSTNNLHWEVLASELRLIRQIEQGIVQGDVILLGAPIKDPIQIAQQVHSFDKTIPVFILAKPSKCDELRRAIMFAPLLGSVVTPWTIADIDGLSIALISAVERHQQRRRYLDNISSLQPKIGNLALSQPELGHYLGRLLDQAPIGVVSLNAQGCILSTNKQTERILAVNEREVLGLELSQFFSETSQIRLANLLMRSAIGQKFGMNPEVLDTAPQSLKVRYIEATASRMAYRSDQLGYLVILQDVTERERAEQRRNKAEDHMRLLSSALEQAADAVMITDGNRVIEYVNPAFELLTGYSKKEVVGQKTYFLRAGTYNNTFYKDIMHTISRGKNYRGVLVNRRKDGSIYHEEKTITPLRNSDGKITQYISTGHDITERLSAEAATRTHLAELAHVARLSTLGEMTSGLAHELNQPLCAIKTYAQTCLRIVQGKHHSREKLNYGLENVVKQAELAGAIFQRLRNFSRKGELTRRRVDLIEIVNEVVTLISAEMAQQHVTIDLNFEGDSFIVMADPIQIEQVLLNLVRNSMDSVVDASPPEKHLKLKIATHSDTQYKVSLADSGKGCPIDVVNRIFEPFFTTKTSGLGVGLGISQSIIEAHGGRLYLESNDSRGATFSFTLLKED